MSTYKPNLYFKERPFTSSVKFDVHSMNPEGLQTYYGNRISPSYDFIPYHPRYLKYHLLENQKFKKEEQKSVKPRETVPVKKEQVAEEPTLLKKGSVKQEVNNYPNRYDELRKSNTRSKNVKIGEPYQNRTYRSKVGFTLNNVPHTAGGPRNEQTRQHWRKIERTGKPSVMLKSAETMVKSREYPAVADIKEKKNKFVIGGHLSRYIIKVPECYFLRE